MADIRQMQLGQVVDFIITHNQRRKNAEERAKKAKRGSTKRKATQKDIDLFFG